MTRTPHLCNDVRAELARKLVISRPQHRHLSNAISHLTRTGELVQVLPRVFTAAEHLHYWEVRFAAVGRWDPDAVIMGAAAARLTFWPKAPLETLWVASNRRIRRAWLRLTDRRIPPELILERRGVRLTATALTALDLGADAIDNALRVGAVALADLQAAMDLIHGQRLNSARRLVLAESRDEPWSKLEREAHRVLHRAGLTGWRTNYPVRIDPWVLTVDVAFPRLRVAIEFDGLEFHSSPEAFQRDRTKANRLTLAGWLVLRFTWEDVTQRPEEVIAAIRAALKRQAMAG